MARSGMSLIGLASSSASGGGTYGTVDKRAAVRTVASAAAYQRRAQCTVRRQTENNILYYGRQGREAIDRRLAKLDQEWDIERTLEANAALISLIGLALVGSHQRWYLLPAVVAVFLLQHAVQGWSPPVALVTGSMTNDLY